MNVIAIGVLTLMIFASSITHGHAKSSYTISFFDSCPVSKQVPKQVEMEFAELPKPPDTPLPAVAPPKEMFAGAAGALVFKIGSAFVDFAIKESIARLNDETKYKNGSKIFTENFEGQGDGFFTIDASGSYVPIILHKCIVVARGFFQGGDDGIKGGYWSTSQGLETLKTLGLKQRPNFYAELLPTFSPDGTAFRLKPIKVVYPPHVHAKESKLRNKDALSLSIQLRMADSKVLFAGGLLFKKRVIGNLSQPQEKIGRTNSLPSEFFGPLFKVDGRGNDLIPIITPSDATIIKIGENKANWAEVLKFVDMHAKRIAPYITKIEYTSWANKPAVVKNLFYLRTILDASERAKVGLPKKESLPKVVKKLEVADTNSEKIRKREVAIIRSDFFLKHFSSQIKSAGDEYDIKFINEIEANLKLKDELEALEKDVLKSFNQGRDDDKFLKEFKTLKKLIVTIIKNSTSGPYQPFNVYGSVTESEKISKFRKLVQKFYKENASQLGTELLNAAYKPFDIKTKIARAETDAEISINNLKLNDAKLRLEEAKIADKNNAELRSIDIEIRELENKIGNLGRKF